VREITSSLSDKDATASTLDKVEIRNKNVEQEKPVEVIKGGKRSLNEELVGEDVPVLARIDKRVRFSGESDNEQSNSVRTQVNKTVIKKYNLSDDDETEEEEDDDDVSDKVQPKSRQILAPPVKIVRQKNDKKNKKKTISRPAERISSESPILSRKKVVSAKKKIKIIRKRPTPRIRTSKQLTAAWVQKYNIEECCICLDLYDPIYETGRD
jgi:hypothetical protein